jgi:hypothetical protein
MPFRHNGRSGKRTSLLNKKPSLCWRGSSGHIFSRAGRILKDGLKTQGHYLDAIKKN